MRGKKRDNDKTKRPRSGQEFPLAATGRRMEGVFLFFLYLHLFFQDGTITYGAERRPADFFSNGDRDSGQSLMGAGPRSRSKGHRRLGN